jgi:SulP family sulfate permease
LSDDGSVPSEQPPVASARPRLSSFVFSSFHGYTGASLAPDLLAGLTLLVIAVPEQLATARLAGMPVITGFYAFIAGTVLFALLGSNPQLSVGADSTIAPLFAVGIAHLAPAGSTDYVALVGILAVMVGLIVALVGVLRLGWIAEFLSAPIITGFLAGVAVIIVIHQLPDFFGVSSVGGSNIRRVVHVVTNLGHTNGWTLGLGLGVLAVVFAAERVDRRLPGALVGLVGTTVLVGALGLESHGVSVLGAIAHGAPHLGLTGLSWTKLGSVAPLAGVVALVVVSQTAATTRAFADEGHYDVDVARDFVGTGAGSIVAGLVGSFPVNASPARTAAIATAGGRTQLGGLGAAAALIGLIPAAGLLKDVPLATLAAVLIYVATRVFHLRDLRAIARFDVFEFALALLTMLTVALVGVEQGIGVAVALAIADRARRTERPKLHVLGRVPGTTSWTPLGAADGVAQVPSVLVVLFSTPLWYANADHFRTEILAALPRAEGTLKVIVLDCIGMTDIDYTGCRALNEVVDELTRRDITLVVSRAGDRVSASMKKSGLEHKIGQDHFFSTADAAVRAMGPPAPAS